MNRKFSLAHLTVLDCPPPEMIYIADICGYDYVGLRIISMGLPGETNYDLANNEKLLEQTKRALKNTNVKVNDIELAKITSEKNINEYEPAFQVAQELGVNSILSSIWTSDKKTYIRKFNGLCKLAKNYDLKVDLEFVTWSDVMNLKEAKEVLDMTNLDNVGIMIDMLHFHRSKVQLEELENLPDDWFNFIHLCDGPKEIPDWNDEEALIKTGRDERLYIGEGEINIAEILKRIPDDVVYAIELPHIERVKELGYTEHARRCLNSAKNYFDEFVNK